MFGALFSIFQEEADKVEKALAKDPDLHKQFRIAMKAIDDGRIPPYNPEFERKLMEPLKDGNTLIEGAENSPLDSKEHSEETVRDNH
jgi:hypothetical protein